MGDKSIWKILAILIAFVVASCITPCIAVVSDSTDNIGYLNKIEQYRTSEDRIIEVNNISCISSSSADGIATSGISKLYIINHHLSEYPPSSRLIEGKRFIYDDGDYWTWGTYSLKGDISGTSYSYRLWLGSDSSTTFKIEIIINGATVATFPLLTVPYDPYYQPFSGDVTGLDPTTSSGDEVILKITKISGGAGSILYFGSAASSYITIPPLATQPIQSIQSKIDAAKPGDTIIIEDGIYNENVKVNKRLTIRSENGMDKTIIQAANSNDHVFGITADYVNISGFTVKGATGWGKAGIYLGIGVKHCNISGNTALNNNRGILLYCSNTNNITKNNATNNDIGIYLNSYSSNNTLINNTVNSNSDFGIGVAFSSNNTLINNTISNNRHGVRLYLSHNNKINSCNFEKDGFSISHSYENEIKDCYVNGKPLIYLENEKDKTINYAGQVILINSRNITIKGCNLSDTSMGIILDGSSRNTVSNNGICDNNLCGIYFNDSSNNYIYLNNFVNNSDNVCSYRSTNIWNLTEKITYTYNGKNYENSLGNYWSDYAGSDLNEDGIGDTPYSIDSDKDNYPLIELFENYFAPTVPTCKIELQKNGVKIDKIGVGEWFNIVITEYSGDIKKVRFLSDESQNGKVDECFTWTEWYDWNTSKEDRTGHWYASNKTKTWAFATSGEKEVWAEVKDGEGRTAYCHAGIYASSTPTPKTIYVPDDYSKIQWAVNNASAGDTIIVRDGTYCENVVVDKSLTIKSENGAEYTTIDGGGSGDVVKITANNVTIEGFTITGGSDWYAGLCIGSSGNKIISNKISNNWWGINRVSNNNQILNNNCSNNDWDGIALSGSNNIIANNNCSNNDWDGIDLSGSNNIISNNNCSNNGVNGIDLFGSNNNTITDSIASNNHVGGIQLAFSNNNTISNNTCSNNNKGIYLVHSNNNSIYLNSFIKNVDNVRSSYSTNIWNSTEKITYTYNETTCTNYLGNYWDDYEGNDANGDGIGDTSYTIDRDKDDCYPLMERFENYLPKSSSHEENAYSHLYEVMDKYNEFFDVYTGGDAAGNHYIPSGWMGDWNDLTFNGSYIIDPHSGPNCIKVTYSADFYENNHYIPSGWMGDWNDITFNDSYTSDPHSGANCIKINYSANGSQGNNWSGIYWQDPENNWGDKIGGFNLTGAAELTFWAKGEKGGEKMEFKVGGINRHAYNVYTDKNAANNHYFPSGWYNGASNMLFNDNWMDNPHSGTSCIKVTWNGAAGNDGWKWNGVMWQNPENNLAGDSGYGYNLTGATKLTFWARTDEPGLKVKFLMGYPADTSGEVLINERTDGWVELYTNWTQYEIDLSGRDLSDIAGGFAFVFNDVNDPDPDGCTFYLDDIKYDKVTLYDLDKPYQDSCGPVSSGLITLTNNWQRYAINLTNENLSHIIGGFCGVANKDNNPEGCAFYLDDIKYEYKYGDKSFNVYTDAQQNWAGIYWQDPENNWGNCSEGGYNLTGATNLSFWAKGANGTEKIEFKIGGIGWDPKTDQQIARYPDSLHPAVSTGIINLTTEWKQYTVDLTGNNLSRVIGGFCWVTNTTLNPNGCTFYLDDIRYNKQHLDDLRFLVSYETTSALEDKYMKNVAFTYDNALVMLAFMARGSEEDWRRAKILGDSFVYCQNHDRYFNDGRLRNAYQAGDIADYQGKARLPGWWNDSEQKWFEDKGSVGSSTGNIAWTMIALLCYYEATGNTTYLESAERLGDWIYNNTYDTRFYGGYTGGYEGWGANQTKPLWKSTEHNLDVYVAFMKLYSATNDSVWQSRAIHAKNFAMSMWNEDDGHFWTGTKDNETINKDVLPADVNTWGLMVLGEAYGAGVKWVEDNCKVTSCPEGCGFTGFDFNNDKDGVWFEGTAHMCIAYQIMNEINKSDDYISKIRKAQTSASNNNGKGIVAACHDGVTTGFDWVYNNRLHIGATSWYIFAERGYNPYWQINTSDTIPY